MTKQKSTKRALLMSGLALLMCVSMLIGSTFAWFTDSVTSGNNKIVAGTLKVDLEVLGEDGKYVSVRDMNGPIFDYELWEPGYTEVKTLKIQNEGNLALKYQLNVTAEKADSILANVIDVYMCFNESTATSAADLADTSKWWKCGTLAEMMADPAGFTQGKLLPAGAEYDGALLGQNGVAIGEITASIALHMQESAGNEYQGLDLGNIDITLLATQFTYEKDSFDDQYDKDAIYSTDVWDGTVDTSWYNETEVEFELATAEEFAGLSVLVNEGNDFAGKTIRLVIDVDLANREWTPIGVKDGPTFNGIFDGDNHSITNMKITDHSGYAALFGATNGATIQNLTVTGNVSGADVAGIVARMSGGGTIKNCVNRANISGSKKAAGIVVMNRDADTVIEDCTNYGVITSKNDRAAGIINLVQTWDAVTTVRNCANYGAVSSTGPATYGAGGIIGWADCKDLVVEKCNNTADISGLGVVGGILGGSGAKGTAKFVACVNSGSVSVAASKNGELYAGGIIGRVQGNEIGASASDCINNGVLSGMDMQTVAEDAAFNSNTYTKLYIVGGADVTISNGTIYRYMVNYGNLSIVEDAVIDFTALALENYGDMIMNCKMEKGSLALKEGSTTIIKGGTYTFTCESDRRSGLCVEAGTITFKKNNGTELWSEDEVNAVIAEGSTATQSGNAWVVSAQ